MLRSAGLPCRGASPSNRGRGGTTLRRNCRPFIFHSQGNSGVVQSTHLAQRVGRCMQTAAELAAGISQDSRREPLFL